MADVQEKLYCVIDNSNEFCFIEAENAKKALVIYTRYIGENAEAFEKTMEILSYQEMLFILNKFNQKGMSISCLLEIDRTLFGDVDTVKESDFK